MATTNKVPIWKPVEIVDSINIKTREDGLIGIEECLNYDINDFVSTKDNKRKRKKNYQNSHKGKQTKCDDTLKKNLHQNNLLSPSRVGSTTEVIKNANNQIQETENVELEGWSSFGFPKSLLLGLKNLNFNQPTPIQSLTLPAAILGRRDVLGASETGSGKTLAFGLPILTGILQIKSGLNSVDSVMVKRNVSKTFYALILTPTRELAFQIKNHLDAVAQYTGIKIAVIVGGMASVKQERILSEGPEIVIATPGRLWELIQHGNEHLSQLDNIRYLAIDETDRMLERGHFQELHSLLERINTDPSKKKMRQNFVFSATLTLVHELPDYLKYKVKKSSKIEEMTAAQKLQKIVDILGITDPKVVDITQETGTSSTLTECRISCDMTEKDYYIYYFIKKHPGKTLIFCNSIGCVRRLSTLLNLLGCHPLPLHASMQQRQRLTSLERFRDIDNSILIATDVAARGLDIPCIEHVLHYQTPRTSESYVHRSGRTARASHQGITVLLIGPDEVQSYLKICTTLGKNKDLPIFPIEEYYLKAVKQRVNLAREIDKLQLQVRKTNSETGWFKKMAEDMDIIVDVKKKYDIKEAKQWKNLADIKRKLLTSLLATPIFPAGFRKGLSLNISNLSMIIEKPLNETKAIDIMQQAEELSSKQKKKIPALYKLKKKLPVKGNGNIRINKNKNFKEKKKLKIKNKNNH